jgi:Bacterial archaeo-eukaryotic release factor family 3
MAAPSVAFDEIVSAPALKQLAGARGPCITIVMPLPDPIELHTRLKNAVHGLEKRNGEIAGLLEPIRAAAAAIDSQGVWAKAMMVLRSPEVFHGYWLRGLQKEVVDAGDRFHLRPLFAAMSREQSFYLLALSQGSVRLFSSTMFHADEIQLPGTVPRNIRDWMNTRQPDHMMDNRSAGGPSVGSMKGVMFGTSADREKHDEYVRHFFKEIDHAVHTTLREGAAPLVLAGVETELAMYRRLNSYPHLFDQEVHGSPDGLPLPDVLDRARDLVGRAPSEALRKALADLERRPVAHDAAEILNMAREGRVGELLIPEDTEDDRLDLAALEVLRHGGRVFAVNPAEAPGNSGVAAILRY